MPCCTGSRDAEVVRSKAFARVRLHQLCAIEVPQFVVGAIGEADYRLRRWSCICSTR